MKRCPQCEFIYEDDQSLCDMDGVLLVLDSRTLPNLHALAPVEVPVTPGAKAYWRHRTFPAMAALILATVLSLVYFVLNQRPVQSATPGGITTPIANPAAPAEAPDSTTEPPPPPVVNGAAVTAAEEATPEPTKAPTPAASKKTSAKTPGTQNQTVEPKKDDSKVTSILKKTGRILKKPFKF
ncbi:MAG TPA: hypothetical protein VK893_11075 [Pyrinomonadaceae bacterium]|nr:hypothetical protein [Pyrinomonadaceae bacterium]